MTERRAGATGLVLLAMAAATLTGCTTGGSAEAVDARATAAALGVAGSVQAGPTGGETADARVAWRLNEQEYLRLSDAARTAFGRPQGQPVAYTIEPQNIDAEPTAVSATPVGPVADQAGVPCRPMRLQAIKGGRTSSGVFTVCRGASGVRIAGRA